ncbi:MAG: hypothetical protein WC570_04230 [Patescibacteria group bacterium]
MIHDTIANIIEKGQTPLGKDTDGQILALDTAERPGIMVLFGRSGQGRSITLQELVIADIHAGRGGLFIDPYGDLFENIKNYLPAGQADRIIIFEAMAGSLKDNIDKIQVTIDFTTLQADQPKFILCKIDYRTLGHELVIKLGNYIVKQFLQHTTGQNQTLALDEAYNFIDEEVLAQILSRPDSGLSCLLSSQSAMDYQTEIKANILPVAHHVVSFFVDPYTAKIINQYHPDLAVETLSVLEKFHFLARLNIQTNAPIIKSLNSIFPIPYPKNN